MGSALPAELRPKSGSGATRALADAMNTAAPAGVVPRTPSARAQQGAQSASATGTPLRQPSRKQMGAAANANAPLPVSQAPPLYGYPLPQSLALRQATNTNTNARRPSPQHTPAPASNKYSSSPHRRYSTNLQAPDSRLEATALALASPTLNFARAPVPARAKQSPAPEYTPVIVCATPSKCCKVLLFKQLYS